MRYYEIDETVNPAAAAAKRAAAHKKIDDARRQKAEAARQYQDKLDSARDKESAAVAANISSNYMDT